jgi:NDP-sugar pyrophosphorylase family protein
MTEASRLASAAAGRLGKPAPLTAIIPIGGGGGQLSPMTEGQPKAMLPLGDRPVLGWIVESLNPDVFDKIYIVHSKFDPMVQRYLTQAFPEDMATGRIELRKSVGRPPQIVKHLAPHLGERFLMHYGDIVLPRALNWASVVREYDRRADDERTFGGLLLASREYQYPVGVIHTDEFDSSRIVDFQEKPSAITGDHIHVNCAVAIFSHDFVDQIADDDEDLFAESVDRALHRHTQMRIWDRSVPWLHVQQTSDWVDVQAAFFAGDNDKLNDHQKALRARLVEMGLLE